MSDPTMGSDTRGAYDAWHGRYPVDDLADTPWHRLVKKHLDLTRDLKGKRVLEIGCGRGGFAWWLATQPARAARVIAVDLSHSAITKARDFAAERAASPLEWLLGDIEALPHPTGAFDTVISCETIEHVPDPRRAIAELARVLRPGGHLFLTTPNYLGPMGLYRLYLRLRGRQYTEEGQPINQLVLLPRTRHWVVNAGLVVVAVDATGHYLLFPRRPPIEVPALGYPHVLMRWCALHSLIVAEKR
jgi:2-polyprenyl-3-methyl-5-hydroxy-6-metoxy-1,4-benzoquinol methylase